MTYHASPEALSLETFEAIRDTIKEQFCVTCWDRKCEMTNIIPHADLCCSCKSHKTSYNAIDLDGIDYFLVTCSWYPTSRMFFKHSPKCAYYEQIHEAIRGYK